MVLLFLASHHSSSTPHQVVTARAPTTLIADESCKYWFDVPDSRFRFHNIQPGTCCLLFCRIRGSREGSHRSRSSSEVGSVGSPGSHIPAEQGSSSLPLPDRSSSPVRENAGGGQLGSRLGRPAALSMPPLIGSVSPDFARESEPDSPSNLAERQQHEHDDPDMLELYSSAVPQPGSSRGQQRR